MKLIFEIDEYGTKKWFNSKKELHRLDGPAKEYTDGRKDWYINGDLHRNDGPAREWANGDKEWYINGKQHREDGPAFEGFDGLNYYYIDNVPLSCKDNEEFLRIIKLKYLI